MFFNNNDRQCDIPQALLQYEGWVLELLCLVFVLDNFSIPVEITSKYCKSLNWSNNST